MKKRLLKKIYGLIIAFIILVLAISIFYYIKYRNATYLTYVSYVKDGNLQVEETNLSTKKIKEKYQEYEFVKIDTFKSIKEINMDELNELIKTSSKNNFVYSLRFNHQIFLLSEELNANNIINFEKNTLNYSNLYNYINMRDQYYFYNKIDTIEIRPEK